MPNFRLVNPVVLGSAKTSFNTSSPSNAAKMTWESLSSHMVNSNPKFAFTLQNTSDGKLFHFLVKEKVTNKKVDYTIDQLSLSLNKKDEEGLINHASKIMDEQEGGADDKKKKSDSSDSDSDSSSTESVYEKIKMMKNRNTLGPITYWWYYPYFYRVDSYVDSVYIPTFQYPIAPYVELHVGPLGSAAWGV